jgi:uncharacterized glyoxalase superfamily metalloenzyme YdcJ
VVGDRGAASPIAQAVAVFGWIRGATEAETFERKIRAEAEAYAEARVRKDRRTGFSAPS